MDDVLLVSALQRFGDLLSDGQRLVNWNRAALQSFLKRLAFDQFHDDARLLSRIFKPVNLRDVGMIQAGKNLSFALKPRKPVSIVSEMIRQELQRNVTLKLGIKRTKDDTHPPFNER